MRPRYLEIEGLQSFKEKQYIDFDKLSEIGLFGIFGPTGSGKSTVLDAMTLALYGNVQRALRGTQGIINTSLPDMRVLLVFDLIKEGKRKTFKVERVYKRKKDSEISVEAKSTRFFELINDEALIISDKQSEVNACIIDLIGLQFDDFTRSVVLPQNKFQEFLLSPKSEKTKMLERIFYMEEYGRQLTDKLNRRLSFIKTRYSVLEGAMSVLGDASHEALIASQKKLKETQKYKNAVNEKAKVLENQYLNAKEAVEIIKEIDAASEAEQAHLSKQNEVNKKKYIFENGQKANSIENLISGYRELEKNIIDTKERLKITEQALTAHKAELDAAEKQYEERNTMLKERLPELIDYKAKLNNTLATIGELDALKLQLDQLKEKYLLEKDKNKKLDKEAESIKKNIQDINDFVSTKKKTIEETKISADYRKAVQQSILLLEALTSMENEIKKYEKEHKELLDIIHRLKIDSEKCEKEKSKLLKEIDMQKQALAENEKNNPTVKDEARISEDEYYSIKAVLDNLKYRKKSLEELNNKFNQQSKYMQEEKAVRDKYAENIDELTERKNKVEMELAVYIEQLEGNNAYILSKKLEEGKPCPVCGSASHPQPAHASSSEEAEQAQQQIKKLELDIKRLDEKIKALKNLWLEKDSLIKNIENNLKQIEQEVKEKKSEYDNLIKELPSNISNLNLAAIEKYLEEIKANNEKYKEQVVLWEKNREEIKAKLLKLEAEVNEHKITESSITAHRNVNTKSLQKLETEKESLLAKALEKNSFYKTFINKLGISNPKEELERIEAIEKNIEMLQQEIDKLIKNEESYRSKLDKAVEMKNISTNMLSDIEAEGRSVRRQKDINEEKVRLIIGDKNAFEELKKASSEIEEIQKEEKTALDKVSTARELYNNNLTQLKTLENQKVLYEKKYKLEEVKLQEELLQKGFDSIVQAEGFIISQEKLKEISIYIEEFENTIKSLKMKKHILNTKLNGRTITDTEWEAIKSSYEEILKEKDISISNYENAKNSHENIKINYEKWVKLSSEFNAVKGKREALEHIQKLLKGSSFIEFVSEERLRYIAREASDTLSVLTKHKYSLELDTDNGFVVRDNANGGVTRLVSTLSGGETFLTSLSLALALSSQIQLKGQSPLEFFFLDEGFGTLDNNLLDTVIDSLERLGSNNRVIGLISHVPELKNRMSRRLLIEPPTKEGKGSLVSIEKA